jgi:hypothetical protein
MLLPVLLAYGCSSMNDTEKGAVTGGAIGAGTGALLGSLTHHTGAGALIGGGIGALSGGLIGNAVDQSKKEQDAKLAAATAPPPQAPLQLVDIARMAQEHVSDDIIINQIRTTRSVYAPLTTDQILWLRQQGVSETIIREMQATAYRYPRRVYTEAPVVVYEPAPPPVAVGLGVGMRFSR